MSIRKNTLLNLMGAVAPIGVTLITVPIYLNLIGAERYGTLAILWALMGYFGFMDLGLGRAIAQRLASPVGRSPLQRSGLVWTALAMTTLLGTLAGIILWFSADFILSNWIEMSPENLVEAKGAVHWFVVALPLIFSASILNGALHGRQNFLAMNLLSITGTTLAQLLPLAVAAFGHVGLDWLVPAALSARLITFVINFVYCRRRLPLRGMPHFHPEQVKPLFSFGGWVSVSGLMAPLLTAIDRLIIGALAGLAAVTHYTIPYNLSSRLTIFSASYSSALFPRMAMDGKDGNKRQLIKRMKIISALIAPVFVLAAYAVEPFFTYWIDAEFSANASPIALLLVLGFLFNSMAILMFNYLQACGRPDLIAKSQLIQLPIYLMLLYVLLEQMGVIGAALATALRMFMGFSFLVVIVRLVQQAVTVTWLPVLLVAVAVSINYFGLFDRFVLVAVGAVHLAISLVAACVANKEVLCVRLFSQ